jgi:hypothetical protein
VIVSFTGTRRGANHWQRVFVRQHLSHLRPSAVAHGACVGADDQLDEIAAELGIHRLVWPSTASTRVPDERLRARTGSSLTIMSPLPPLERDRLIVDAGEILIATPAETLEVCRSGTWATVRPLRPSDGQAGDPHHALSLKGLRAA